MSASDDKVLLGRIVSAHGLKGWVKIKTFTQDPQDLVAYGPLKTPLNESIQLHIQKIQTASSVLASLKGCVTREQAEALVGLELWIDRTQLPLTGIDEFYYHDLMGMTVRDEDKNTVGFITQVNNYGAGDFLEIQGEQGLSYTLPFYKDAIAEVDLKEKVIRIYRSFLL